MSNRRNGLIVRAPIWKPAPVFVVFRKHLSKRVKQELAKLQKISPKTLDYVMRRSIEMLFEGITKQDEEIFYSRNYFLSIKRYNLLQWRFDNDNENNNECNSTITFEINYFEYDNEGREIGRILDHNKMGAKIMRTIEDDEDTILSGLTFKEFIF